MLVKGGRVAQIQALPNFYKTFVSISRLGTSITLKTEKNQFQRQVVNKIKEDNFMNIIF